MTTRSPRSFTALLHKHTESRLARSAGTVWLAGLLFLLLMAPGTYATAAGLDRPGVAHADDSPMAGQAGGTITGTVRAVRSASGVVPGAQLFLLNSAGVSVASASTNASGVYTIATPASGSGTYYLRTFYAPNLGYYDQIYEGITCLTTCPLITSGTPIVVGAGQTVSNRDFSLSGTGTINGRLTDARTGLPIANAVVYVHASTGVSLGAVSTDVSGNYSLIGIPAGTYYVRTYAALSHGYVDQVYDGIPCESCWTITNGTPIVVGAGRTVSNINFALAWGGIVTGLVTDADTHAAISSAWVYLFNSAGAEVTHVLTNTSGVFTFGNLATGTYYVRTSASSLGYIDQLHQDVACPFDCAVTTGTAIAVTAGLATSNINFALARGGTITGTVTDADTHAGINSTQVWLYGSNGYGISGYPTNAAGVFRFPGLPSGSYYVRTNASSLGYLDQLHQGILCAPTCTVTTGTAIAVTAPGTTSNINFALGKAATITGTVTDAATIVVIPNVTVQLFGSSGQVMGAVVANASGVFTFRSLVAGTYYVRTSNAGSLGYVNQLYQGVPCPFSCTVTTGTAIAVTAGQAVSNINFALARGATITGTLIEAGTPLGIGGSTVQLYNSSGGGLSSTTTNMSGVYSFNGLSAGTYYLRTFAANAGFLDQIYQGLPCVGDCAIGLGTPVTVTAMQTVSNINFTLARSATITGTITNAGTAALISGQAVEIYDQSRRLVTYALSNASGVYSAGKLLAPGTYYARTVDAGIAGYLDQLYQGTSCASGCTVTLGQPIVVTTTGQVVSNINFPLVAGATITGTVTGAADTALSNVTVIIYNGLGRFVRSASTNASGVFTAGGLDTGTYYAQTSNTQGYINQVFSGISCAAGCNATTGQAITLTVPQTRSSVNFALTQGGMISGTVVGLIPPMIGIVLPGIGVAAYNTAGQFVASATTNASGVYTIGGLAAGNYFVRTTTADNVGALDQLYPDLPCGGGLCTVTAGQAVAATPGQTTSGVGFALTKGASIQGTVISSVNSAPVSGLSVQAWTAGGTLLGSTSTNAAGMYSINGLPTGSYFVKTSNDSGWIDLLYPAVVCPSGACVLKSGQSVAVTAPVVTTGINFSLTPGRHIKGTVTDSVSHAGIFGATVTIFDAVGTHLRSTTTDSTGAYDVGGLAPGSYFAAAFPAAYGYTTQAYRGLACPIGTCPASSGTAIAVAAGADTAGIDFALDPTGSITGKLMQANGITPLGGPATVTVHRQDGALFRSVATATSDSATGVYFVPDLPAGSYYVSTSNLLGFADQAYNGQPCPGGSVYCDKSVGTPVVVQAGLSTTGINFSLSAASTLSGTVRSGGVPQAGLPVTVLQSAPGAPVVVSTVVTGTDGRYSVPGLRSGAYFVFVTGTSTATAPMAYNSVPLPAGATPAEVAAVGTGVTVTAPLAVAGIDFSLTTGGAIAGKVLWNSTPVTSHTVWAYRPDGTPAKGVAGQFTDGSYLLTGLPAGTYFLIVYPPRQADYVTQLYGGLPCMAGACDVTAGTPVVVSAGQTTGGIDFSLGTGGQISGLVTDSVTGAPLSNFFVKIWRADPTGPVTVGWATTTNSFGTWNVSGLAAGTYFATTWGTLGHADQVYRAMTCAGCDATKGTPITVAAGQTTSGIDFALVPIPAAGNDQFAQATVIANLPYQDIVDTRHATKGVEDPTPTCGSRSTEHSVWYSYTATYSGTLMLDTFGSSFYTILSAYTGSPGGFASVGCNEGADPVTGQSRLTIPVVNGRTYSIMVGSSPGGGSGGFGGTLVLHAAVGPTLAVTPATLRFAGTNAGGTLSPITPVQTVTVSFSSAVAAAWTASANQPWVQITGGSGIGSGTFRVSMINPGNVLAGVTSASATVTVTAADASNSPQTVAVTLTLKPDVLYQPAVGLVEAPAQGATGRVGAIGVTGWVVDDVGVRSVKIYRNCLWFEPAINCGVVNGVNLVYIGDATIVTGARPDIEIAYATYPMNNRAGWGYLLLTNMLPHLPYGLMFGGQGTLTLHVLAEDIEGHQRWLGRDFIAAPSLANETPTTFTMANDTIAKPFGAIDTPTQGQTVSGSFWNFGWTLTPDSNTTAEAGDILMPLTGATQWVYIDGVAVAPIGAYNLCRGTVGSPPTAGIYCNDDVSSIFGNPTPLPTFTPRAGNATRHRNLDAGRGPIAAYYLDTTTLANGVHTIVWGVTDSAGRGEGIGSRYFTVLNGSFDSRPDGTALAQDRSADAGGTSAGDASARGVPQASETALREAPAQARGVASALETLALATDPVWGRTGYDVNAPYADVADDDAGVRQVQIPDLGRLELSLGAVERGYLVANGTLRDLPPGSHLNIETGVFTWSVGLAYLGTYRLVFVRGGEQIPIDVTVRPMAPMGDGLSEIRMAVDVPRAGAVLSGATTIAGWALDPQAWTGTGIDAVHVWAQRLDIAAAAPQFLGAAALGGERPDVAQVYGPRFGTAGFSLTTDVLAPGTYDLTIFVRNRLTGRWGDARTVRVNVR